MSAKRSRVHGRSIRPPSPPFLSSQFGLTFIGRAPRSTQRNRRRHPGRWSSPAGPRRRRSAAGHKSTSPRQSARRATAYFRGSWVGCGAIRRHGEVWATLRPATVRVEVFLNPLGRRKTAAMIIDVHAKGDGGGPLSKARRGYPNQLVTCEHEER